jgi:hypothetical protein
MLKDCANYRIKYTYTLKAFTTKMEKHNEARNIKHFSSFYGEKVVQ